MAEKEAKKPLYKKLLDFINRGNVIDMAVGVVIGGAFGKIVSSLVSDVIMPLTGTILTGIDFSQLKLILVRARPEIVEEGVVVQKALEEVALNYGAFIQQIVDFAIIAICVFAIIQIVDTLRTRFIKVEPPPEPEPEGPPVPTEAELLMEIRDLLKKQAGEEK